MPRPRLFLLFPLLVAATASATTALLRGGGEASAKQAEPVGAPPRKGIEAPGNSTMKQFMGSGSMRDGQCYWHYDMKLGHMWFSGVTAFKDHESETVTLKVTGHTPECNDPSYPQYLGSFLLEVHFSGTGYMQTGWMHYANCRHDGGLSAYDFECSAAITGMWSYDPNVECGSTYISVADDICGYF